MATLVFGAIGTLVGGPLGGAIGSLIGNKVDRAVLGGGRREGPRLTELHVASSSYGLPIPRLFGTVRTAGTIVWATDLKESSEAESGGKGQATTTQYSYTISLAVALSSRPIGEVGRVWADGNLLRGAAGDLKTGGTFRVHRGWRDQEPDPLLAAALGAACPAFRGTAYVVLEDLALGDFGNRVPALSFEVFADGAGTDLPRALAKPAGREVIVAPVPSAAGLSGFAQDGGDIASGLDAVAMLAPLAVTPSANAGLAIGPQPMSDPAQMPPAIAWPDGEFGARTGQRRTDRGGAAPNQLRYYDPARDYQPGLQRSGGRSPGGSERVLELPATIHAGDARHMLEDLRLRTAAEGARAQVRVASLDSLYDPGALVLSEEGALWRVEEWEWREGGVELGLARAAPAIALAAGGDSGQPWRPADREAAATLLHAFSLPWDGKGSPDADPVLVAANTQGGRWAGAALYVERSGTLQPLGVAASARAVTGRLAAPLAASPALMFEAAGALVVTLDDPEGAFASTSGALLATGANRLLVGEEILQFQRADPLGDGRWSLSGLLRGRGATEAEAALGHAVGTPVVLLDDSVLLTVDGTAIDAVHERLAAIGMADPEPVFAAIAAPGRARRPLSPVHGASTPAAGGGLRLAWTRRARGEWLWRDEVATPLVEEVETYEVGSGSPQAPTAVWTVAEPMLVLDSATASNLDPGEPLWVRQVGKFGRSRPALLPR